MSEDFFEIDHDYKDVYFMMVDAKGHSKIIIENDADKADQAFDKFEEMVYEAVNSKKRKTRCQVAGFWGWQGDGGLCVFYDKDESKARETAICSAEEILAEISPLNERLQRLEVTGQIHVRIALHKGNIRYKGSFKHGSIHSRDLNLVSHAEKVVPTDTLAISADVFAICGSLKKDFFKAEGSFEDKEFYLYGLRQKEEIMKEWKENLSNIGETKIVGLNSNIPSAELGLSGLFSQRAETAEYSKLIASAKQCIWVSGIGLEGFQYDFSDEILFRKAVEGVEIRFLVADPKVTININGKPRQMPAWADYAINSGSHNQNALKSLVQKVHSLNKRIAEDKSAGKKLISLKYYSTFPAAMLRVDSTVYFSPYLAKRPGVKTFTLKFREGKLYDQVIGNFTAVWNDSKYSRNDS